MGTSLAQVAAGTDVAGSAAHEHISQPKESDMKRIITGLFGGAAMLGMVSTAQAQFAFGLFDTNRDMFVNPVEFGIGLGRSGFFGGNEGFLDTFDADDSGFLGLNASLRRTRNPMPPGDRVRPVCPLRWDDKAPPHRASGGAVEESIRHHLRACEAVPEEPST